MFDLMWSRIVSALLDPMRMVSDLDCLSQLRWRSSSGDPY